MFFHFIHVGETNRIHNVDKYACAFSKMIQYWRQVWNERKNGTTDIQFPFGFVQVGLFRITNSTFMHRLLEKSILFVVRNMSEKYHMG